MWLNTNTEKVSKIDKTPHINFIKTGLVSMWQTGREEIFWTVIFMASIQARLIGVNGYVVDMKFVQNPSRISKNTCQTEPYLDTR